MTTLDVPRRAGARPRLGTGRRNRRHRARPPRQRRAWQAAGARSAASPCASSAWTRRDGAARLGRPRAGGHAQDAPARDRRRLERARHHQRRRARRRDLAHGVGRARLRRRGALRAARAGRRRRVGLRFPRLLGLQVLRPARRRAVGPARSARRRSTSRSSSRRRTTAPERLETGTQNHEGIVGAGAAVDFLASLARPAARGRERLAPRSTVLAELHARGHALVDAALERAAGDPGRHRLRPAALRAAHAHGARSSSRAGRPTKSRARWCARGVRVERRLLRADGHRAPRPRARRRRARGLRVLHDRERSGAVDRGGRGDRGIAGSAPEVLGAGCWVLGAVLKCRVLGAECGAECQVPGAEVRS